MRERCSRRSSCGLIEFGVRLDLPGPGVLKLNCTFRGSICLNARPGHVVGSALDEAPPPGDARGDLLEDAGLAIVDRFTRSMKTSFLASHAGEFGRDAGDFIGDTGGTTSDALGTCITF